MKTPECNDTRECCIRRSGKCLALNSTYPDGKCPFAKEKKDVISYKTQALRDLRSMSNTEKIGGTDENYD